MSLWLPSSAWSCRWIGSWRAGGARFIGTLTTGGWPCALHCSLNTLQGRAGGPEAVPCPRPGALTQRLWPNTAAGGAPSAVSFSFFLPPLQGLVDSGRGWIRVNPARCAGGPRKAGPRVRHQKPLALQPPPHAPQQLLLLFQGQAAAPRHRRRRCCGRRLAATAHHFLDCGPAGVERNAGRLQQKGWQQ